MKRAMGLILMVLGFAMVAHGDRIAYDGAAVIPRAGEVLGVSATLDATTGTAIPGDDTGTIAWRGSSLSASKSQARLTDDVFYPPLGESAKIGGDSAGFDFFRGVSGGFTGTRDDGRGGRFGIYDPEPFHRYLGVQEIPEPGTLHLLAVGLVLMAIWMRRSAVHAEDPGHVR